jgi:alpha,alpha-trehalose phosphorylase
VARHPDVAGALGVNDEEVASWQAAADAMYVPYDAERGIHPQDQDFLLHERWDFAATPADHYPLLLHYTYFDLYRRQVVKQADLVLALFVRSSAFTAEQKRRDFDYYEGVTVRDSSLSAATQAIVAAEVGHLDLAHSYLAEAAFMDLHDLEHNIRDGLHIASLAGAAWAVIAGLGGLRDDGDELAFSPRLPRGIKRVAFTLAFSGNSLRVAIKRSEATYSSSENGEALSFFHWGERVRLAPGTTLSRPIPAMEPAQAPNQPTHRAPLPVGRRGARRRG